MESLKSYWNDRYRDVNVREAGNRGFSPKYNTWYYKAKERVFRESISQFGISITGNRVVDVGAGTGFLVDLFLKEGAAYILGLDIAEKSINYLRHKYSQHQTVEFHCFDIARKQPVPFGQFDIVAVFDLLYLIVDEMGFSRSLENVCSIVSQDGYVFIVDMFPPADVQIGDYIVCRSLPRYETTLASLGFEILGIIPQFFLLNRSRLGRLPTALMDLFPGLVYYGDRLALALGISGDGNRSGASFKLLVARRRQPK